jgi:hypothetical protein
MSRCIEVDGSAPQRVLSIPEFCRRYGIGRSKTYLEIKAGRLKGCKCGDRLLIAADAAEHWLRSLPPATRQHQSNRPKSAKRIHGGVS